MKFIERKPLWWFGHLIKKEDSALIRKPIKSSGKQNRKRGRPRKKWA